MYVSPTGLALFVILLIYGLYKLYIYILKCLESDCPDYIVDDSSDLNKEIKDFWN